MKTTIKSITVVNQQGTHTYAVGEMHDARTIACIIEQSMEYQDCIEFIYRGFDKDNQPIFELVNVPVDIQYMTIEE